MRFFAPSRNVVLVLCLFAHSNLTNKHKKLHTTYICYCCTYAREDKIFHVCRLFRESYCITLSNHQVVQKSDKSCVMFFLLGGHPGLIPPELGLLSALQQLELQGNALTGVIPKELGGLVNLQYLGLHDNQLLGAERERMCALLCAKRKKVFTFCMDLDFVMLNNWHCLICCNVYIPACAVPKNKIKK